VVIVSCIRIAFIIEVGPDFTWDYTNPIIWSGIETSVAVVCACLPTLRPVAQYAVSGLNSIRLRSTASTSESPHQLRTIPTNASYVGPSRDRKDYRQFKRLEEGRGFGPVVPAKREFPRMALGMHLGWGMVGPVDVILRSLKRQGCPAYSLARSTYGWNIGNMTSLGVTDSRGVSSTSQPDETDEVLSIVVGLVTIDIIFSDDNYDWRPSNSWGSLGNRIGGHCPGVFSSALKRHLENFVVG